MRNLDIIQNIINGYWNMLFPKPSIEKLAKYRMSICNTCPHKGYYYFTLFKFKLWKISKCNRCGCVLNAKTRSLEAKCPINKW